MPICTFDPIEATSPALTCQWSFPWSRWRTACSRNSNHLKAGVRMPTNTTHMPISACCRLCIITSSKCTPPPLPTHPYYGWFSFSFLPPLIPVRKILDKCQRLFTERIPIMLPNQHCQNTKENFHKIYNTQNISQIMTIDVIPSYVCSFMFDKISSLWKSNKIITKVVCITHCTLAMLTNTKAKHEYTFIFLLLYTLLTYMYKIWLGESSIKSYHIHHNFSSHFSASLSPRKMHITYINIFDMQKQ